MPNPPQRCRAAAAGLLLLLAAGVVRDAAAFRIAADQVRGVGVYAAIEPAPAAPVFDLRDAGAIAALLAGIDFDEQLDCSEFGAAPEAIAWVEFADGAVGRYEILSGYEYIAKPGLPGACHALTDAAGQQLRTLTHVTPCVATPPLVCNGACAPGTTCATSGICIGGPIGTPCTPTNPWICAGYPCAPVACACVAE